MPSRPLARLALPFKISLRRGRYKFRNTALSGNSLGSLKVLRLHLARPLTPCLSKFLLTEGGINSEIPRCRVCRSDRSSFYGFTSLVPLRLVFRNFFSPRSDFSTVLVFTSGQNKKPRLLLYATSALLLRDHSIIFFARSTTVLTTPSIPSVEEFTVRS